MHTVLRRHKHAERIIGVNDPYDQQHTIKDSERLLRQKNASISNFYMKSVHKFPAMKDFDLLLGKSENKIRLQTFLQSGFQNVAERSAVEIIYCVGDSAQNLSIGQFASEYSCFHSEADTAMFYIYLRAQGYTNAVILDTDDTDNCVQAAYASHQISEVLCTKTKTEIIDAKSLCNNEMAANIIPLNASLATIINLVSMV